MANFNRKERLIAGALSKFPTVKRVLKRWYSAINYLFHRKSYQYLSDFNVTRYGDSAKDSFFGYYDKCPLSPCGRYVLYQETASSNVLPCDSSVIVLCEDVISGEVVYEAPTKAFNWQQGCKLHWLSESRFVYNDYCEEYGYHSKIVDLLSDKPKILPIPVYDCFIPSNYALCLNYTRLSSLSPDYGYFAHDKTELLPLSEDGIWRLDTCTGKNKLLISLEEVSLLSSKRYDLEKFKECQLDHTVNHIMISPNGKRFIFIHRWYVNGKRRDRLILSSIDGNMEVLADNSMVSHCCWNGDDQVVSYLKGEDGENSYWILEPDNRSQVRFECAELSALGDGHPSICNGWLLTDTYPDKSRMQQLVAVNLATRRFKKLGEFFHGLEFNEETRCDLHPRFSNDGKRVFFDSVFSGRRGLYSIDVELD